MIRYIYKHKNTGQKIRSENKMRSDDFELVREIKNTKKSKNNVITKGKKKCPECGKKFINLGSHMKKHD